MDRDTVSILAVVGLIILGLQFTVILFVIGGVLFFAYRYLRMGRAFLKTILLRVYVLSLRVQYGTTRVTNAAVSVPIEILSRGAQVIGFGRALYPILSTKRGERKS